MGVSRGDVDFQILRKSRIELSKGLAQDPLKAVALMCFAEFAGDCDPQFRLPSVSSSVVKGEKLAEQPKTSFLKVDELSSGKHSGGLGELLPFQAGLQQRTKQKVSCVR